MRAQVMHGYGGPDELRLVEIDRPEPSADEVLIRVDATSVNPLDSHEMRGEPWLMRLGKGVRRPKHGGRGNDLAGEVVATGDRVDDLPLGTAVFGVGTGAFAEYAIARRTHLAPAPTSIDAIGAASLPIAGLTALQAVRAAALRDEARVLVIGASGGVGTLVVQIAAHAGAHVAGVCSTTNVELVRSLGAGDVVDYTTGGLDTITGPFAAIVDMVGSLPMRRVEQLLDRDGTYVVIGGPDGGRLLGPLGHMIRAKVAFAGRRRRARTLIAAIGAGDLADLARLVDTGAIRPVIDQVVPFDSLPDAMRRLETHRARGKIVIQPNA